VNQRESSTGLGGGGNALARSTSATSTDTAAAALGMSRRNPSDVGREILLWRLGDDTRNLDKIERAIAAHLAVWAERNGVRTRYKEALRAAINLASRASMAAVRHPCLHHTGTQRTTETMEST
jgi:hypothetical protein